MGNDAIEGNQDAVLDKRPRICPPENISGPEREARNLIRWEAHSQVHDIPIISRGDDLKNKKAWTRLSRARTPDAMFEPAASGSRPDPLRWQDCDHCRHEETLGAETSRSCQGGDEEDRQGSQTG